MHISTLTTLIIIISGIIGIVVFLLHPKFGKYPSGQRLKRIKNSPNYSGNSFKNLRPAPLLKGNSRLGVYAKFLLAKKIRPYPKSPLPTIKTDLQSLSKHQDTLVWFGHSSYFMQLNAKTFLVDPVFSPTASPFSFATKAFPGTNIYSARDMPIIDNLIITHDHWDHLSFETICTLAPKLKQIVCPLGVGEHLEYWGINPKIIKETDWFEDTEIAPGFIIFTLPAHHHSGRRLTRHSQTLWASYALKTPKLNIFISGDGGYDSHFAEIGNQFGGFDLAIIENGQYNETWPHAHMHPNETIKAALDLKAKTLLPSHSCKFVISHHPWDEPLTRICELAKQTPELRIATPQIGQPVDLNDHNQVFTAWWEKVL